MQSRTAQIQIQIWDLWGPKTLKSISRRFCCRYRTFWLWICVIAWSELAEGTRITEKSPQQPMNVYSRQSSVSLFQFPGSLTSLSPSLVNTRTNSLCASSHIVNARTQAEFPPSVFSQRLFTSHCRQQGSKIHALQNLQSSMLGGLKKALGKVMVSLEVFCDFARLQLIIWEYHALIFKPHQMLVMLALCSTRKTIWPDMPALRAQGIMISESSDLSSQGIMRIKLLASLIGKPMLWCIQRLQSFDSFSLLKLGCAFSELPNSCRALAKGVQMRLMRILLMVLPAGKTCKLL